MILRLTALVVLLISRQTLAAEPAVAEKPALPKVVLVGDSIRMAYAPLVAEKLKGRATVISSPKNGGDSSNVLKLLDEFVIAHQPQFVHLNSGLHDLKFDKATKRHQVPLADYEKNLREIVARIQKETNATILFALTTPIHDGNHAKRGGTFDRFEADVAKYNEAATRVMSELKIPLTDLHAVVERGGIDKLQTADGTHYAEAGKQVQAAAVAEAIEKVLPPVVEKTSQAKQEAKSDGTVKPRNVVIILADDLRPDGLAALGNKIVKTPHLDALINRGYVFRNAYTQGSFVGAVCLPSRFQLLTGKSLFRFPVAGGKNAPVAKNTLPAVFKQAGFYAVHAGKNGNSPANIHAQFDVWPDGKTGANHAEQNVDLLLSAVKSHGDKQPLMFYLSGHEPHDPQFAPAEFYKMYRAEDIPLPANFLPLHPFDNGEMLIRDEKTLPHPRTKADVTDKLAKYYASISYLDAQVGRLVAGLKAAGQYDNTLFVIGSDNGLSLGDHGLLGKQNLYERGGMHVPLIFVGPGVAKGESQALVYLMDVLPTLCDFSGVKLPDDIDGKSLQPNIDGTAKSVRETLLTAYRDVQRAVRDDRWKLIRYPQVDVTQLFDLQTDPLEMNNLAEKPEFADKLREMTAKLVAVQKQFGDTAPLTVAMPKAKEWMPK